MGEFDQTAGSVLKYVAIEGGFLGALPGFDSKGWVTVEECPVTMESTAIKAKVESPTWESEGG